MVSVVASTKMTGGDARKKPGGRQIVPPVHVDHLVSSHTVITIGYPTKLDPYSSVEPLHCSSAWYRSVERIYYSARTCTVRRTLDLHVDSTAAIAAALLEGR